MHECHICKNDEGKKLHENAICSGPQSKSDSANRHSAQENIVGVIDSTEGRTTEHDGRQSQGSLKVILKEPNVLSSTNAIHRHGTDHSQTRYR